MSEPSPLVAIVAGLKDYFTTLQAEDQALVAGGGDPEWPLLDKLAFNVYEDPTFSQLPCLDFHPLEVTPDVDLHSGRRGKSARGKLAFDLLITGAQYAATCAQLFDTVYELQRALASNRLPQFVPAGWVLVVRYTQAEPVKGQSGVLLGVTG